MTQRHARKFKATRLKLKNFGKYQSFDIEFDNSVTYLIGPNGAGKTTAGLTGIWFVLQGIAARNSKTTRPLIGDRLEFFNDPKKKKAEGILFLRDSDGIVYQIERTSTANGNKVEIFTTDEEGPELDQGFLDQIFNQFLIAPKAFTQLPPKDQAEYFGIDVTAFEKAMDELKSEYYFINKQIRAKGEVVVPEKVERVNQTKLAVDYREAVDLNRNTQQAREELKDAEEDVERLTRELEEAKNLVCEWKDKVDELPNPVDAEAIKAKIDEAEETNRAADAYEKAKAELDEIKSLKGDLEAIKEKQAEAKRQFIEECRAAGLPEGCEIDEDGSLLYDGRPLKEPHFSTGEILTILPTILSNVRGGLEYVFLQDFNLLDESHQSEIEKTLTDQGFQLVVELVGDREKEGRNSIVLIERKEESTKG